MMAATRAVPFNTTYWVVPGRLLAGDYPYSDDPASGQERLAQFFAAGINCFIDLTHPVDAVAYQKTARQICSQKGLEFWYYRKAIRDFSCPSQHRMKQILDLIDSGLDLGRSIYVHCRGGIGRTGTVVGCFLVRHGMNGVESINALKALRKHTVDWFHDSPETEDQRRLILNWVVGE